MVSQERLCSRPVSGFTVVYSDHAPRLLSRSASISTIALLASVRLSESSATRSGPPPCSKATFPSAVYVLLIWPYGVSNCIDQTKLAPVRVCWDSYCT